MRYIGSVIVLMSCVCLLACSHLRDWNVIGNYTGAGMSLCLKSDSSAILNVRYSPTGFGGNGRWRDTGNYVVVDFPKDTAYNPLDISNLMIHRFEMETVVLEKRKQGNLIWINRGLLKKQ